MGLAVLNTQTGEMVMTQCGHPYSVIQRAGGKIELSGTGGLPIGLIPDAAWDDHTITLASGDRILIASDGISECPDMNGKLLGDEGVIKLMRRNARLSGNAFFETIMWDLISFAGDIPFPDDISAVLLEYQGPGDAL
jgi:sigma-B regulation protein RsbU (phosphoserine phosphatase)